MTTWTIDQAHSTIGFKVKHLMISTVKGTFKNFSGSITAADEAFEGAEIKFSAEAKSVDTNNEQRDQHLRSADFFDVENHPEITFVSESFTRQDDKYELTGQLTMRGVTKPVVLEVIFDGVGVGMNGEKVAGFDITGKINRQDFGLSWSAVLETGGVVASDEVVFDIHVEVIQG